MKIKEADVAELVDARDLKAFAQMPVLLKQLDNFEKRPSLGTRQSGNKPAGLQNAFQVKTSINKVTARGSEG